MDPEGKFELNELSSGVIKVGVKAERVYFNEKRVNIDLSSAQVLDSKSAQFQQLNSLAKFVATSFDVKLSL